LVTYEQHKNKNSSNSCCINSSNISSRSNIRSSSALCIRLFTKDDKKDKKDGRNDNGNTVTAQVNKQKRVKVDGMTNKNKKHKTLYVHIQPAVHHV